MKELCDFKKHRITFPTLQLTLSLEKLKINKKKNPAKNCWLHLMSFASPSLPFIPRGIPLYRTLPAWQCLSCVALSRAPSSLALDLNLPLLFSSLTLPYSLSPLTPPRSARKCFSIRCRIAILIHMFSLVEVSFASLVSPLPATLHSPATPCATLLKLVRGCSWSTQSQ